MAPSIGDSAGGHYHAIDRLLHWIALLAGNPVQGLGKLMIAIRRGSH